jgi:hypothetical protein
VIDIRRNVQGLAGVLVENFLSSVVTGIAEVIDLLLRKPQV